MLGRTIGGLLAVCAAACAHAAPPAEDFPALTNLATLARSFPLPALGEPQVPESGVLELASEVVNEFESDGFDAAGACVSVECLRLDGETTRVAVRWRGSLGSHFEYGLELPYLFQGGGFLDTTIETWHDWFSLPNNGREYLPRDQYRFYYERAGTVLLDVTDPGSGPGDASVSLGWQAGDAVMLRALAKLPTGDAARLTGGNAGAAVWADAALPLAGAWSGYLGLGASFADRGDVLSTMQRRVLPFGGAGVRWHWGPSLSFHVQTYVHGGMFDGSRQRPLTALGAPLAVGGRWRFSRSVTLDLGIHEDLSVTVSPDFIAQMVIRTRL